MSQLLRCDVTKQRYSADGAQGLHRLLLVLYELSGTLSSTRLGLLDRPIPEVEINYRAV